jgi:hypothetical protein
MNLISEVDKIRARIATLPAHERALFQQEQVWAAKHPILNSLALIGLGIVLGLVAAAAFGH